MPHSAAALIKRGPIAIKRAAAVSRRLRELGNESDANAVVQLLKDHSDALRKLEKLSK